MWRSALVGSKPSLTAAAGRRGGGSPAASLDHLRHAAGQQLLDCLAAGPRLARPRRDGTRHPHGGGHPGPSVRVRRRDLVTSAAGGQQPARTGAASRMRVQPLPAVIFATFGVLAGGMVLAAVLLYSSYASSLPDVTVLEEYAPDEGSVVFSADEQQLATFAETNRHVVDYEQIPTVIVDATVSAEDHTYWENPCVDPRAMVRAMLQNVSAGEVVSGASTICQQLVQRVAPPDLMADPDRQLERKIKEAMLALELDAAYPGQEGKEQIMEFFLNEMYYGNNGYGIWAAVNRYYGKDFLAAVGARPGASPGPSVAQRGAQPRGRPGAEPAPRPNEVTAGEAAMLAGLLRAPSELDPTQYGIPVTDEAGQPVPGILEVPATRSRCSSGTTCSATW